MTKPAVPQASTSLSHEQYEYYRAHPEVAKAAREALKRVLDEAISGESRNTAEVSSGSNQRFLDLGLDNIIPDYRVHDFSRLIKSSPSLRIYAQNFTGFFRSFNHTNALSERLNKPDFETIIYADDHQKGHDSWDVLPSEEYDFSYVASSMEQAFRHPVSDNRLAYLFKCRYPHALPSLLIATNEVTVASVALSALSIPTTHMAFVWKRNAAESEPFSIAFYYSAVLSQSSSDTVFASPLPVSPPPTDQSENNTI